MATENLTRFVESFSCSNKLIKKVDSSVIRESLSKIPTRIRESISSDVPEGWWVPISHYGNYKNGNGRIYNKKLWDNVINTQRDTYIGSPMLCDHPEGDKDGNPKDICGVWLDCKMGQANCDGVGIVYGLLIPSGRLGEDLKDHLKNGLKVGTSSSGFGKLMNDNMTVDPDTYQIERLADFVLTPSQGTYFSWDESSNTIEDKIHESMDDEETSMYESNTNNNVIIKENKVKDPKFTKLEEKKFRRDMESFLESANEIKDPQARLAEFKEIKSYLEDGICPDLKEKVEQKIAEEEEAIKKILQESVIMKEELGIESTRELKEKLTQICQDTKNAEKEAKDWKSISEQLQQKIAELKEELEDRPTNEFMDFQRTKINQLSEQMNKHDADSSKVVVQLTQAYKELKEAYDRTVTNLKNMTASSDCLIEEVKELKESLDTMTSEKEALAEKLESTEKSLKENTDRLYKAQALFNKERARYVESVNENTKLKALNEKMDTKVSSLSREIKNAQFSLRESAQREREAKRVREQKDMSETEKFYESLYKQYGNEIVPYKERIAGAKTIAEAKSYFYKKVVENLRDSKAVEEMRLPESWAIEPEDRVRTMKGAKFVKESPIERLPKGWV